MSIGSFPLTRGTRSTDLHFLRSERFIPAYAGNSSHFQFPNRIWTVHPCLRGELGSVAGLPWKTRGSSPLTRGTRVCCRVALENTRFIPAYAGNSRVEVERTGLKPVHPRLRGELDLRFLVIMIVYGSSPLTRGTLHFFISDKLFRGSSPLTRGTQVGIGMITNGTRFIPAYAGNSLKMVTTLH